MTSYGPQETVDFMFRFVNASEIEPEALADFRLNDFGDRLAPQAKKQSLGMMTNCGTPACVVAFSEKCRKRTAD